MKKHHESKREAQGAAASKPNPMFGWVNKYDVDGDVFMCASY